MASPLTVQPCTIDTTLNQDQPTTNFGTLDWVQPVSKVNNDNIYAFKFEGLGKLSLSVQGLRI